MAERNLNSIFLSASIPLETRDKKYFDTADIIAIRESVKAIATVVLPKAKLVWGGHPAITPLIRHVMDVMGTNIKEHVILYQSDFFKHMLPPDNKYFEDVRFVKANNDLNSSLEDMRLSMLSNNFDAGIFIGGMEGVEIEFDLFRKMHPDALILPVASTGAAAQLIYEKMELKPDIRLTNDYAYMALFRYLLNEIIN